MDFQCDRCSQKYHVADEKLQGRTASRFKCKKCENVILLSPDGEAPDSVAPPSITAKPPGLRAATSTSPLRAPAAGPRPLAAPAAPPAKAAPAVAPRGRLPTSTSPSFGSPGFAAAAAQRSPSSRPNVAPQPSVAALLNPDDSGWYAGVRDLPIGPLTRAELAARVHAGEVTGDALVWREGYTDWKPLRTVAALKDLLPALRVVSHRSPLTGDEDATMVAPQSPQMVAAIFAQSDPGPKADQGPQEAPTRKLSALTDEHLRSVRLPAQAEKPAPAAAPRPAPAPKPAPATVSKPAPLARPATGVAPAARPASPAPLAAPRKPSVPPAPPPRASVSSKPAVAEKVDSAPPLASFSTSEAPAATVSVPRAAPLPTFDVAHEEPTHAREPDLATHRPSLSAQAAAAALDVPTPGDAADARASHRSAATASVAPSAVASDAAAPDAWADAMFKSSVPPPPSVASPAPMAVREGAWNDPVFQSVPPPAPHSPDAVPATATSAPPAPQRTSQRPSLPAALVNTGPLGVSVEVPRASARSIPKGAWLMAAGVLVAGLAGGLAVSRKTSAAPNVAASVSARAGVTPESLPAALPAPGALAAEGAGDLSASDMTFTGDENTPGHPARRRDPSAVRAATPTQAAQTAANQARLERMLGVSPGGSATPVVVPVVTTQLRNTGGQSASADGVSAAQGPVRMRDRVRESEAVNLVRSRGAIGSCVEVSRRRNPASLHGRARLVVNVAADGRLHVQVNDAPDPQLASCIERSANALRMVPGAAVRAESDLDLN